MYKKTILLGLAALVLIAGSQAWAATWTGLGGDRDWFNAANWDTGVPGETEAVLIDDCNAADGPIITSDVTCGQIQGPGYEEACTHTLDATGSIFNIGGMFRFANGSNVISIVTLTDCVTSIAGDFRWGDSTDADGIFNVIGGSLDAGRLKIGDDGGGELNVSGGAVVTIGTELTCSGAQTTVITLDGGTISVATNFDLNTDSVSLNLDAGTIECGSFDFGGPVDINEGTLIVAGNVSVAAQNAEDNDLLTAYNEGTGWDVIIDYNAVDDKTYITGIADFTWARFPTPEDQQENLCPDAVTLSWTAGVFATDHDVYLGTDYTDVKTATTSTAGIYKVRQSETSYDPGTLVTGTTYYWRIDETDGVTIWPGRVWEFSINDGSAFDPDPANNATGVALDPTLSWTAGCSATSHNVYFGTDRDDVDNATTSSPEFKGNQAGTTYNPPTLSYLADYYWRVDEIDGGTIKGEIWKFRAKSQIIDPNMVLWYEFEEGSGGAIGDSSGYEHHGAVVGASGAPDWEPNGGKYGGTLRMDGSFDLSVDSDTLNSVNNAITIAFWINDSEDGLGEIEAFDTGSGDQQILIWAPDSLGDVSFKAGDDTNDVLVWASAVPSAWRGEWHHMAFLKNETADLMNIYYDGVTVTSKSDVSSSLAGIGGQTVQIGGNHDGAYDDFKIFNRALSDNEVAGLFRGGNVNSAWAPTPFSGAVDVDRSVVLKWLPGDSAVEHDLYLGTSFDDVNDADTTSAVYVGRLGPNEHDAGDLVLNQTYYWRVDEVNNADGNSPWIGEIWRFTVANFLNVDNMESYDPFINRIWQTWDNPWGTGSFVELGAAPFAPVHVGSQSMEYIYDNFSKWDFFSYWSEAQRDFDSSQDWTDAGVQVLTLYFYGDPGNAIGDTEQFSIGVEGTSRVDVDLPDMNDLLVAEWQEWNIPLSDFSAATLTAIDTVYLKFGDSSNTDTQGGDGLVYFDDIRLYPSRCVPELGPAFDFSGDCIVGFAEVAMLGDQWLMQDQILGAITAPDPCVLHYKFDESSGTTVADSSGNGYTGVDFNDVDQTPSDITGRMDPGVSGNSFHFSHASDAETVGIKIPPEVFTDNAISQEITIAMWIKNAHPSETPDGGAFMLEFREWDGIAIDGGPRVLAVQTEGNGDEYIFHDNSESVSYDLDWDSHTEWNHYSFIRDAANLSIYVNGVLAEVSDSNGSPMADPNLLYLGLSADRAPGNTEGLHDGFTGNIDDFQIFDYALTEAQAGYVGTGGTGYVPLNAQLNIYDAESAGNKAVNFKDYALLMQSWLDKQFWP